MWLLFWVFGLYCCYSAAEIESECDIDLIGDYKVAVADRPLKDTAELKKMPPSNRLFPPLTTTTTEDPNYKESIQITCPDSMAIDGYFENEIGHKIRFSGLHKFNQRELTLTCHCSEAEAKAGRCYYEPQPFTYISPYIFEQLILKDVQRIGKDPPYFLPVKQVTQIHCNQPTEADLCAMELSADANISPKTIVNEAQGSENYADIKEFATSVTEPVTISCPKSMTLFGTKHGYSVDEIVRKIKFFSKKIELLCHCSTEICNFQPKEKLLVGILNEKTASIDEHDLYDKFGNNRLIDITRVQCSSEDPPRILQTSKTICSIELLNQAYVTGLRSYVENEAQDKNLDTKRYFITSGRSAPQITVHCPENKMLLVTDKMTRIQKAATRLMLMCIGVGGHLQDLNGDAKTGKFVYQVICLEPWKPVYINPFKREVQQMDSSFKPNCGRDGYCSYAAECVLKFDDQIKVYSRKMQKRILGFKQNDWKLGVPTGWIFDLECPEGSPFILGGVYKSKEFSNAPHNYRTMTLRCLCNPYCNIWVDNKRSFEDSHLSLHEGSNEIIYSNIKKSTVHPREAKCGIQDSTKLQKACSFEFFDEKLTIESQNPYFLNEEDAQIFGGRPNLFTTRQDGHVVNIICPENNRIKLTADRFLPNRLFLNRNDWLVRQVTPTRGYKGLHIELSCQCSVRDIYGFGCYFKPLASGFGSLRTSIWPPENMIEHRKSKNDLIIHVTSAKCVAANQKTNQYDDIEFQKMGKSCGLAFGNGAKYASKIPNRAKDRKSFFSTNRNKAALVIRCAAPNALMISARFIEKLKNGKTRHSGLTNAKLARTAITLTCYCNPKKNNCAFRAPGYKYGKGPKNTILFKKMKTSMTTVSLVYCQRRID